MELRWPPNPQYRSAAAGPVRFPPWWGLDDVLAHAPLPLDRQRTPAVNRALTAHRDPFEDWRLRAVVPAESPIDLEKATKAVADLLDALGVDGSAEGLAGTAARVARAYASALTPEPFEATTFPNDDGYDELVVSRSMPFSSLCEHHLMPFSGVAHVGYLPADRLVGLSKLARVVTHFSRRLQVQERLTNQVADWLSASLHPKGVGVVLEAAHTCMTTRGTCAIGARTVTSALQGLVRDDERTRAEFLALALGRH
jgi:GTP cyclohydrolase I